MNEVNGVEGWFSQLKWSSNPFTLEIDPSLFVGYSEELKNVKDSLDEGQKFILITGPTGAGKTTFLKLLSERYEVIYLPKPPINEKELVEIFRTKYLKPSLIDCLLKKDDLNIYNLAETFNQKYNGKKVLMLVDEAHETKVHVLEWLRTLSDQIYGMTLILAGLPKLKSDYLSMLETLSQRISLEVELNALSKEDSVNLVKRRISNVGGQGLEPFTMDALINVYDNSGGFPREVLKICNNLIHMAIERNSTIIDSSYFDSKPQVNVVEQLNSAMEKLTEKQRAIVDVLDDGPKTPSQLINMIDITDYQSHSHALRSVNNILRRLCDMGLVMREKSGKAYMYKISPKLKSIKVSA